MSMIECAECGAKISSEAKVCPTCGGNPDSKTVKAKKSALRIGITLGILLMVLLLWSRCTAWIYGFS